MKRRAGILCLRSGLNEINLSHTKDRPSCVHTRCREAASPSRSLLLAVCGFSIVRLPLIACRCVARTRYAPVCATMVERYCCCEDLCLAKLGPPDVVSNKNNVTSKVQLCGRKLFPPTTMASDCARSASVLAAEVHQR